MNLVMHEFIRRILLLTLSGRFPPHPPLRLSRQRQHAAKQALCRKLLETLLPDPPVDQPDDAPPVHRK